MRIWKRKMINAYNLWDYEDEKYEASEDTRHLIKVFKKVKQIFCEAGVNKMCLKLK